MHLYMAMQMTECKTSLHQPQPQPEGDAMVQESLFSSIFLFIFESRRSIAWVLGVGFSNTDNIRSAIVHSDDNRGLVIAAAHGFSISVTISCTYRYIPT